MATAFDDLGYSLAFGNKFLNATMLFKDLAKVKVLYGHVNNAGGGGYAALREWGSTTSYLIPTGKVYVLASIMNFFDGTTGGQLLFGTVESDIGFTSSSAGTNSQLMNIGAISNAVVRTNYNYYMRAPSGVYVSMKGETTNGNSYLLAFGFELDSSAEAV